MAWRKAKPAAQPKRCRRIRPDWARINPLMHYADSLPVMLRILVPLPLCRCLSAIDRVKTKEVDRIPGAKLFGGIRFGREFGIEVNVRPPGPIEEFEIAEQRGVRPHI